MRALLFSLLVFFGFTSSESADRPNVVFILADDLGWSDTTLYGTTKLYQTPHLERLAARGMTFTRAYSASPLCSPTRSAILTGLSPARTGITTPNCHEPAEVLSASPGTSAPPSKKSIAPIPPTRLKREYRTLAEILRDAGYATGHFGKWHLGPEPFSPLEQGFDVDVPHHPGPGPAGSFVAPWKYPDFKENSPGEHIEDRMAAEAVAWMEEHRGKPFFLNYWMFSVHAPFDAKKDLIANYRDLVDPADEQRSPTYAAMVESMDDAVGTLLDAIDRLGLAEKTIIVFSSDNGGNMYNEIDGTTPTSNRPLRGGKATLFEGGVRVPGVVVWPGVTPPGSRSDTPIQSEDFLPTLRDGLSLTREEGAIHDGISLLPALRGEPVSERPLFRYFPHDPGVPDWLPPSVSVSRGDWKLIRIFHGGENGAHRWLLYDLAKDPGETTNLASAEPGRVAELDDLIVGFLSETQAVVPIANPAFDPARYRPELEGKQQPKGKGNDKSKGKGASKNDWSLSKDALFVREESMPWLVSKGGDPWMSTRVPASAQGPFTLSLRLSSSAKGAAWIYYGTPETPGFDKSRTLPLALRHDGTSQDFEVALTFPRLTALRLDPATGPGEIAIERFELRDAAGQIVTLPAFP
ncbi:MAG: sulfatase [Verrucomicrobiales bacterium]|nr:sulfatase [Verrucomicrobiales bacterium]